MTPNEAKKNLKQYLDENRLTYTKLKAQTISFIDLARDYRIFVTVQGWKPDKRAKDVEQYAAQHGFSAEFEQ